MPKNKNVPISRPCGATEIDAQKFMASYKAAAYIRLSYTDDKQNESDSVGNQRRLIEDFAKRNPDIEIVMEKIDDGYSGIILAEVR